MSVRQGSPMHKAATVATFRLLSLMLLLTRPVSVLAQATINVPRDQPTIQAGIDAANDGDTVLVAPGRYVENIDFSGKAITVASSGGAAKTIIDGGATGPTVTFQTGEPRAAALSGFTIQNGGGYGPNSTAAGIAGVVVSDSSPTILNNIVTQNQCWDIEILDAAPLIQGNTISSTQSPPGGCGPGSGAGIYVSGNLYGDSSSADGSAAAITGNTIENITISPAVESSQAFTNLYNENGGAGIAVIDGGPLIENNTIRNNSAPDGNGGGINVAGGSGATIAQNLIYGNNAGCGGGAISLADTYTGGDLVIANNTIVDNTGGSKDPYTSCGDVSQIYGVNFGLSAPNAIFVNNIVSGSTAAPAVGCSSLPGTPSEAEQSIFDHNLFYNLGGSFFGPTCIDVSAKYGNIAAAPQFANPAQGDYHLLKDAPGIDSGNNSALGNIDELSGTTLATDFDGNPRVQDATGVGYPIIDMGAYEYTGVVDASPTTIVLASSVYTGKPGDPMTLFAVIQSGLGVPTGSLSFFLDGEQIGSDAITSHGDAHLDTVVPGPGTHSLYASYEGAGSFTRARSVIIIVTGEGAPASEMYTTSLVVGAYINPQQYGMDETLTVLGASSDPNPAFSPSPVTLTLNGTTVIGSLTPDNKGLSRLFIKTLPIGPDLITASYAGDATHEASTASTTVDIDGFGTYTSLDINPTTILVGQTSLLTANVSTEAGPAAGSVIFTDDGEAVGEARLVNGAATLNYLGRTTGSHTMKASYPSFGPDYPSMSCPPSANPCPDTLIVVGLPSTAVLSVSPSSGPFQTPTTMTAIVSPASLPGMGTPTGTVDFLNGTTLLGSANLAGGVATFNTIALPTGMDTLTCVYEGDSTYAGSNCNTVSVTRSIAQPVLTITPSANNIPALTPVTFTIALLATGHLAPYRLPVIVSAGGKTYPLTLDPTGTAGVVVSNLQPGPNVITATFAGNANLLSATDSIIETVVAGSSATLLSVAPNPGYVGQPVTLTAMVTAADTLVPSGGVVTFYDGTTVLGTGVLDQSRTATFTTTTLAVGTHTLTASYPGTGVFAGSTSPAVLEKILASSSGNPSATVLAVAPNPAFVGQPVTLTAMVTAQTTQVPAGATVSFYDGTTVLGTGTLGQPTLPAGPTATFTTSSLAVGTHSLTASYPGTSVFAGSTSSPVSEMILANNTGPSSFTIGLSPTTVTIPADQAATVAIQLASIGGFAGPLTLSYGTLPVNASASVLPSTVTLTAGGSGSSTLTLNTASQGPVAANRSMPRTTGWTAVFAATLFLILPGRGRLRVRWSGKRRRLFLWLVVMAALLQTVTGCGDSFYTIAGVAPGTYQIRVTATDVNQNQQNATLTLIVPPQ